MSWFERQLKFLLRGDIAIGGDLTVSGAVNFGLLSYDVVAEGARNIKSSEPTIFGACSRNLTLAARQSALIVAHGCCSSDAVDDVILWEIRRGTTSLMRSLHQFTTSRASTQGKDLPFCIFAVDKNPGAGTYNYNLAWRNNGVATAYARGATLHVFKVRIEG